MISDKVASGELVDASTTIDQMGRGSQEIKTERPKLRLTVKEEQDDQKEESEDGMKHLEINCKVNI